jgi:hypothetical protein
VYSFCFCCELYLCGITCYLVVKPIRISAIFLKLVSNLSESFSSMWFSKRFCLFIKLTFLYSHTYFFTINAHISIKSIWIFFFNAILKEILFIYKDNLLLFCFVLCYCILVPLLLLLLLLLLQEWKPYWWWPGFEPRTLYILCSISARTM